MACAFGWTLVRSLFRRPAVPTHGDVESIVVVGAGFENRGAQAMLFSVMDAIRQRFPQCEVYVAFPGEIHGAEERYRAKVLPWTFAVKARLVGWRLSRNARERFPGAESAHDVAEVLGRASAILDVSGFKLSSEFGVKESLDYCVNLLVGRILGVPYFVLPQSFGPFDYNPVAAVALWPFMSRGLRGAARLWARERTSYQRVARLAPKHLELGPDIVLAHRDRQPERIYRPGDGPRQIEMPVPAACIVPSMQVASRQQGADGALFYTGIVRQIAASGRTVVLLAHSGEDRELCRRIAQEAACGESLIVTGSDLDAIEMEHVIGQMDFMVASRYHSLVHAYRQGVPAVILGWADKYGELAAHVHQERFVLDTRAGQAEVSALVEELIGCHAHESAVIAAAVGDGFIDAAARTVGEL